MTSSLNQNLPTSGLEQPLSTPLPTSKPITFSGRLNFYIFSSPDQPISPPIEVPVKPIVPSVESPVNQVAKNVLSDNLKSITEKKIELLDRIKQWHARYDNATSRLKKFQECNDKISDSLTYIKTNRETIESFLQTVLDDSDYAYAINFLKTDFNSIFTVKPLLELIFGPIEYLVIRKFKLELCQIKSDYELLKEKFSDKTIERNLGEEIDKLLRNTAKLMQKSLKKCGITSTEIFIFRVLPFLIVQYLQHEFKSESVVKIFKIGLTIFRRINTLHSLLKARYKQIHWLSAIEIKNTNIKIIDREIVSEALSGNNHLCYQIPPESPLFDLERKSKVSFEIDLHAKLQTLNLLIDQHVNRDNHLDNFITDLNRYGFRIDSSKLPLNWINHFPNEDFKKQFCEDTLNYHRAYGKLLKKALYHPLKIKIETEKQFLIFDIVKNTVEIVYNLLQILLFIPSTLFDCLKCILEILDDTLPIPGVKLSFLLYPDLNLSLEGVLNLFISHLFGILYKPNEYSLSGYWLDIQKKLFTTLFNIHFVSHTLLKCLYKIVNKCMQLTVCPEDWRFKVDEIDISLMRNRCELENYNKKLDSELIELKKMDLIQLFKQNGIGDFKQFIESLAESLLGARLDFFESEDREFVLTIFRDIPGLTNQNLCSKQSMVDSDLVHKLEKYLISFFLASSLAFFDQYKIKNTTA